MISFKKLKATHLGAVFGFFIGAVLGYNIGDVTVGSVAVPTFITLISIGLMGKCIGIFLVTLVNIFRNK